MQRQPDAEAASPARIALQLDDAAERFDRDFCEGEAEPAAALSPSPRLVDAVEALEDFLMMLGSDTGALVLDLRTRQAERGGDEIALTLREFDVLHCLMRHQGQVVTRPMLAREVWREPNRSTPLDNVIDVHLARLRRKVDEGRDPRLIHTVRGVGFRCGEGGTTPPASRPSSGHASPESA